MKHLVIIGAGAFAREIYWHAKECNGYEKDFDIKGFLDGDLKLEEAEYKKLQMPVLGDVQNYKIEQDDVFTCAIGTPSVRKKMVEIIQNRNGQFINLIHRTSILQGHINMGKGIILCPFTLVGDNVNLGDFVMVNTASTIGHDASIDEYTCLMAHVDITGYSKVGKNVYFGSGSRMLPHSRVDDNAFVGAGSVVLKHVKKGIKVFGVPAIPIE